MRCLSQDQELQALIQSIGKDNIWRPVFDSCGKLLAGGAGHHDEGLPETLPSHIDFHGKTVVDLGCNVGEMVCRAARLGARRAVGVECNPQLVRCAHILAERNKVHNAEFVVRDFADVPQQAYDIAMMFDIIGNTTIGDGKMHHFLDLLMGWAASELIISLKPLCRTQKHFTKTPHEFAQIFPSAHLHGDCFYPVREALDYLTAKGWTLLGELPKGYEESGMKVLLHFAR